MDDVRTVGRAASCEGGRAVGRDAIGVVPFVDRCCPPVNTNEAARRPVTIKVGVAEAALGLEMVGGEIGAQDGGRRAQLLSHVTDALESAECVQSSDEGL